MTAVRAGSLKTLGCVVAVFDDGEAARVAASTTRYDLIFMDCHMPGTDGFEATRRIRDGGRARGTHTPIVALTGDALAADALAGDREHCLASGMDDDMTKPVSTAQLAAAVQRWVAPTRSCVACRPRPRRDVGAAS